MTLQYVTCTCSVGLTQTHTEGTASFRNFVKGESKN